MLLVCDDMGLIGKEMFAINECEMPANVSKKWSGPREDFEHKQTDKDICYQERSVWPR